ncbi:MAG: alpha/beta hydrolase [Deltaproteobacteria bacterium]|nr:alpha/beta hydrolase [Deltaproteobacteria bacterium]MBW2612394.1 alpha/beta hydrolase [Deltaproteobacteria bacterium]MBW2676938.1 alpha/beta hydrolase [Deltaproteobacteria bacterium]
MKLLIIAGIFIGIIVLYLLIVTLFPGFKVPRQPLAGLRPRPVKTESDFSPARRDVSFDVNGTAVSAWLYLPAQASGPSACIVMANGTGGTRDLLLEGYAHRFQAAGMAVLSFDYRHFGGSAGEPRQLIWIPKQLEDYAAAVEFVRGLDEIDAARVALWGTSLSGGHVITTAARDSNIACVVAQCPGVDGRAMAKTALEKFGVKYILRMLMNGQRDYFRGLLGLSPHKIPIVAKPGNIGLITTPGAFEFFPQHVAETYVNEVCARIIIRGDKYRPIKYAADVRCPVLMQVCEKDELIPVKAARETEKRLGSYAEVHYYPIGHFDIYSGEHFKKAVNQQLKFLNKHLQGQ